MSTSENDNQKKIEQAKKSLHSYTRYSGIAIQMIVIIGALTYLGYFADKYFETSFPVFTLIFLLVSVALAMYTIIKKI